MNTQLLFSSTVCFLFLFNTGLVNAQDVYLCVWRNPERTMTKIFPEAKDYSTINLKVTPQQCDSIEKELGSKLLAGQRDQFQYFKMTGNAGKPVGTIIAASQKGEFGAIEFVIGFDTSGNVVDLYIQRSRERDQTFKDRSFLDSFKGAGINDFEKLKTMAANTKSSGQKAVIHGLVKEMVTYKRLVGVHKE